MATSTASSQVTDDMPQIHRTGKGRIVVAKVNLVGMMMMMMMTTIDDDNDDDVDDDNDGVI